MLLALIILAPAVIFLLVRYPFALAVLALFLPMEAPGVGTVIGNMCPIVVPLIYGGYFLAIAKMLHILWVRRNTSFAARRMMRIALLAVGISSWMALSMFASNAHTIETVYRSLGAVPGVLFVLTYYNHPRARLMLILAVAVHLIIGCGIIAFPSSAMAALRPPTSTGALPDVWRLETTMYKDSAQFDSAAQLAFYAAVGVIVGMSLLFYHRRKLIRILGAGLAGLGFAASFFTVERGIWIGILFGLLALIGPLRRKPIGKLVYSATILALALGVYAVCASGDSGLLAALRQHFVSVREDTYRIPVAIRSLDVLISRPLFGVGGEVLDLINQAGGAPHQSFYFFAVTYGIPAGVFVAIMTWWSLAANFTRRRPLQGFSAYDQLLARSLAWVVVAMAMTNGMSGGMLGWIFLGFACLAWAHSSPVYLLPSWAAMGRRQKAWS